MTFQNELVKRFGKWSNYGQRQNVFLCPGISSWEFPSMQKNEKMSCLIQRSKYDVNVGASKLKIDNFDDCASDALYIDSVT